MDLTRGICILLVVLVHTSVPLEDWAKVTFPAEITIFNRFFEPFRMPLLMFLSGMLLEKSLRKAPTEYFTGKLKLIFWPFLVWSLAIYAAEDRLTIEYIIKTPISAPSLLWYLWFLVAYYFLAFFITRSNVRIIFVIIVSLIASSILPAYIRMDRFAALFVFFMAGHLATTRRLPGRIAPWLGVLGLALAVAGGVISAAGTKIKYDPLFVWVPLGLVAFILWLAPKYRTNLFTAPLEWVGRNSIVFYVSHFPIILFTVRAFVPQQSGGGGLLYVALFIWAIAMGAALQIARGRFDLVEALFDFRKVLAMFGPRARPVRS